MRKIFACLFSLLLLSQLTFPFQVFSETPTPTPQSDSSSQSDLSQKLKENQEKQADLEKKLAETRQQKQTLSSQITYMNRQIELTSLKIEETEQRIIQSGQEIASLSAKIGRLEESLTGLSGVLLNRIVETYKRGGIESWQMVLSSNGFSDLLTRLKYIRIIQTHDKRLMYQMEETKANYQDQKALLEEKKKEDERLKLQLDGYKVTLARQKAEKEQFLEITKNDEKRYQEMLTAARAEHQALLKILAGQGETAEIGPVKTGETIGTYIAGASACSNGPHLHFEVVKDGSQQNPINFLRDIGIRDTCNPDSGIVSNCFESQVQHFTPSGSWDWPIVGPVRITQEYGDTFWSRLGWYAGGPHTGVDMASGSFNSPGLTTVKAVADGTLRRGSIACGGGTLRYARVDQPDGIQTYYLHLN